MTFDLGTWPLTAWTYEGSHIISINRTSTFQMRPFSHFSLSYNLTSDDLWPSYMTFDLINQWGFPCCICDPTLVEIHQRMWTIEPNVNPFSQQTTTTADHDNNKQQGTKSDPYVSFLLRQVTQKWVTSCKCEGFAKLIKFQVLTFSSCRKGSTTSWVLSRHRWHPWIHQSSGEKIHKDV